MLDSHDKFIVASNGGVMMPMDGEQIATTATLLANSSFAMQSGPIFQAFPALFGSNTGYIATKLGGVCSTADVMYLVARVINLGSKDLAGSFTDGSAMPTVLEGNVSRQISSLVITEVTTGLSALPGSITITYIDQDGNAAETTAAQALTASAAAGTCGFIVLNGADTGVRDITAATQSGGTTPTGVIKFWGVVSIGFMQFLGSVNEVKSWENANFNPVRHGAGDQIRMFCMNSVSAKRLKGAINFVAES